MNNPSSSVRFTLAGIEVPGPRLPMGAELASAAGYGGYAPAHVCAPMVAVHARLLAAESVTSQPRAPVCVSFHVSRSEATSPTAQVCALPSTAEAGCHQP